jgi:xanthine dehydrogenase YagR molybdenum-binding subunit
MPDGTRHIGHERPRVEGRSKVTGEARYAAEYDAPDMLHGCLVPSRIARGRILCDRHEACTGGFRRRRDIHS